METLLKPKLIVVVGPTASGKTALSLALAKKFKGEVINADSRQVYQKLDIGTEKITVEEMGGIPHHLLDIVAVETIYTSADFKRDADKAITEIRANGNLPIIAGGTFFYIDTLLGKMSTAPVPPNPELRATLETRSEEELFKELEIADPQRASNIDRHNKRRLVRALEIINAVGTVPSQEPTECPYDVLTIGIKVDKEVPRKRLKDRAHKAVEKGLVEETKKLLESGVSKERLLEIGLQYTICMEFLDGSITEAELMQKLEEKNWQYAKRQMMWLKRDQSISWFEAQDEKVFELVEEFLGR